MKTEYELIIIGGGPAGMAAAAAAKKAGIVDLLVLERDSVLGGILNQCIHNGFGLHTFKEELTGPEYAERYADQIRELGIPYELDTMVLALEKCKDSSDKLVRVISSRRGAQTLRAKAVILAMGCRERPRGALNIPGFRPQGVYTAGTAQKLVNIEGVMPGKEVVILGSGDIGLIMARRMTLEGAKVKAVAELMPYSSGLKRNIVQCLEDYDIPLLLSHTVVDIKGKQKLEGVTIAQVDENLSPIKGTEEYYPCDTLLLSCGLIPENELTSGAGITIDPRTNGAVVTESLETDTEGVFACGNVLHVHDLVDFVSEESARAGEAAAKYIREGSIRSASPIRLKTGSGVRYTVPSTIDPESIDDMVHIRFRVTGVLKGQSVVMTSKGKEIFRRKYPILVPSEMLDILLKKEAVMEADGEILVEIKGE